MAQSKKLQALIDHAYRHTRFYHKLFKSAGVSPLCIKTRKDLSKLPTLNKQNLRQHFFELIANDIKLRNCRIMKTSGSTGEPTTFVEDINMARSRITSRILHQLACGIRFGEKILSFFANDTPGIDYAGFNWTVKLPKGPEDAGAPDALMKLKPTVAYGFPSRAKSLAHTVLTRGSRFRFKAVLTTGEQLDDITKQFICEAFNTEVYDHYGCGETGIIAWQCKEQAGYHQNMDDVIVELLSDGEAVADGEQGEVVVTNLCNYTMPLIRYRVGDIAAFDNRSCPCGRKLALLKEIQGRMVDFIVRPDGKLVSPHRLMSKMFYREIAWYQIVQENEHLVTARYVEDVGFTQKIQHTILKDLKRVLGDEVQLRLISVGHIPRDVSGKLRPVISKVKKTTFT